MQYIDIEMQFENVILLACAIPGERPCLSGAFIFIVKIPMKGGEAG